MQHIYAVGETLLDIIFEAKEPKTAKPGGSAFNSAITLGRLHTPIKFISEIGNDRVGDLIMDFMTQNGVDTHYLSRFTEGQSAIALAFLNDRSDAEYQFYKEYPSERLAVDFPEFQKDDLFLFGSFYALNPEIRPRVKALIQKASGAGAIIIYDPNFRNAHALEQEDLLAVIKENMGMATILRASDEDLINIFRVDNPDDAWNRVREHCPVMIYTANAGGVYLRTETLALHLPIEQIKPVSTIGAGDTFNAGMIYGIWKNGFAKDQISTLGTSDWEQIIKGAVTFSREVCLSYDNYLPLEFAQKVIQNEEI